MLFTKPLPFISKFIDELNQGIQELRPNRKLSKTQCWWLSFCLTGILLSNSVCWAEFERIGLGGYKQAALSWMFRHSKIFWLLLLHISIILVLRHYGITEGELAGDDTDKKHAKVTTRIYKAYKIFDKKTGGYFNGQTVVLLYLITPKISLPVGFRFYEPDPVMRQWKKNDEKLKKQGKEVKVMLGSARLHVKAHAQKRFVVALKYEGEEDYRYLVASDMSWRAVDIASAYTLRWLVEVFFEDWKLYEGWG